MMSKSLANSSTFLSLVVKRQRHRVRCVATGYALVDFDVALIFLDTAEDVAVQVGLGNCVRSREHEKHVRKESANSRPRRTHVAAVNGVDVPYLLQQRVILRRQRV